MRRLVFTGLAVAALSSAVAAPASPACALLTDAEVAQFLGGTPIVADGGPEMAGTSSCSWVVQSNGNVIGVQVMTPAAFGGAPDSYYDMMVAGVTNAGQKAEPIEGVGTKAVLISDSTGANLVLMAEVGDKLLNVTTMTVAREVTIDAARLMAGRM